MTTKTNPQSFYSSMYHNDDQLFADEQIQRYDAHTIKNRYGDNWRNYASNVRDIKQADGSIVREYIIEDPSLLKEIKPSFELTSSTTSDDEQQSLKDKFAQIKAKFEQKSVTNIMASPSSSSSIASSNTTVTARQSVDKQSNDLNGRNKLGANSSISNNRSNTEIPNVASIHSGSIQSQTNGHRSQAMSNSSFRRLNSADEADEEVQRIHRQGEEYRHHHDTLTPVSSAPEQHQQSDGIQYEVLDENGNPIAIDDVHDLIKMAGATAREVQQADGTYVREYVIDDPSILSKLRPSQSPSVSQQHRLQEHIPPPPPRMPLKQSVSYHQGQSTTDYQPPMNIEHIRVLEPQRRYEYRTTSGKNIEFIITHIGPENQPMNDTDIRELSNAINTRLIPPSSTISNVAQQQQQQQFTLPKQWHPAVDLTHRNAPVRQRTNSDNQPILNNGQVVYQQAQPMQADLVRSASYGALNQGSYQQTFAPTITEPIIDWSALQQQDPHGQIDPQLIRQYIAQKHQAGSLQTSAQFLPEKKQQTTRSMHSPLRANAPTYYQQQMSYPYQGQQQHGVRIVANQDLSYAQQPQPAMMTYDHTRI